jgi:hypothetical protein
LAEPSASARATDFLALALASAIMKGTGGAKILSKI